MLIQPIDLFVNAWLAIAVLSATYVAWDQFTGNPEASVMKWGFVLVTLYMGPIGLLLYVMADKEPKPGQEGPPCAPELPPPPHEGRARTCVTSRKRKILCMRHPRRKRGRRLRSRFRTAARHPRRECRSEWS